MKLQYVPEMEFDLKTLIKAGIMDHKDAIGDISGISSGEAQLEDSLTKVTKAWETLSFVVLNHRDQHNLFILGSLEEIFATLEDNRDPMTARLALYPDHPGGGRGVEQEASHSVGDPGRGWYARRPGCAGKIRGRTFKQLPAESQDFLIVDRSWPSWLAPEGAAVSERADPPRNKDGEIQLLTSST